MIGGTPFLAYNRQFTEAKKAADIGCGTGVATIQLAQLLPAANVHGIDITPVPEPARAVAPGNTHWVSGNILDVDMQSGDDHLSSDSLVPGTVDYLFGRMLFLGINDWSKYFQVAAKSLSQGGVIEHQDLDWKFYRAGTNHCLSDSWPWHARLMEAVEAAGLSQFSGSSAATLMEKAGLSVVEKQTFEFSFVPSSKTPRSQAMGRYVQRKLMPNYPELLAKMTGAIALADGELQEMTRAALRDLASEEGVHQKYTVTIGRK